MPIESKTESIACTPYFSACTRMGLPIKEKHPAKQNAKPINFVLFAAEKYVEA